MSRFRAYIIPFTDTGEYGEEIEVTQDVDFTSISTVKQELDQNEYKVGVLTFNDLNLKLSNETGKYSEVGSVETIFKYKRSEAIFRLKWDLEDHPPYCGLAVAGQSFLSETRLIYEGLINDDATRTNVRTKFTSLKVLGMESIIKKIEVPFGSISNGDSLSEAIYTILNQSAVTSFLTVDPANINVAFDTTIDDVSDLESKTGKEALDELLLLANSILYVKDRTIYVTSQTATPDSKYIFHGPGSNDGLETTRLIGDIRTGLSKTFNFWTWSEQTFKVENASSIEKFGVRKKEIGSKLITLSTKQQAILGSLVAEFGDPKQNFRLNTPLTYDVLDLFYLDKVNVNYPTVYIAGDGKDIPLYGVSKYDEASYPIPESALYIDINREWKIVGVNINIKQQELEFNLKEI